jgi:hypothetical protein
MRLRTRFWTVYWQTRWNTTQCAIRALTALKLNRLADQLARYNGYRDRLTALDAPAP